MAKVTVIEPWLGGSHRAWALGLAEHSSHDIRILGLEPRGWRWRLRASAPWFADQLHQQPQADVILVSGLVDAAVLRGLVGRQVPMVLYMHESQGAYPRAAEASEVDGAVRNWSSMLAADQVWFNSDYHRRIALGVVDRLGAEMPDEQRVRTTEQIESKSDVVYPGVDLGWTQPKSRSEGPPVILWPHRWEHDKNPEVFERALHRLVQQGLDFRLVLAGADGLDGNPIRARLMERFRDQVFACGPFDQVSYRRWVNASDLVVSCTSHEFFGMAVIEALAAGCSPVLPNDYSYPELVGGAGLYAPGSFGSALADAVSARAKHSVDVSRFDWRNRIRDYDERIEKARGI